MTKPMTDAERVARLRAVMRHLADQPGVPGYFKQSMEDVLYETDPDGGWQTDQQQEQPHDWQVCWYQSLLLLTDMPVQVDVLQDNLTEAEAKLELIHWQQSLAGAVGVVVIARQRPPELPETGGAS